MKIAYKVPDMVQMRQDLIHFNQGDARNTEATEDMRNPEYVKELDKTIHDNVMSMTGSEVFQECKYWGLI